MKGFASSIGRMAIYGLPVMAVGLLLIRLVMSNAGFIIANFGHYSMQMVMAATFSPLWLGGLIGWAVAAGNPATSGKNFTASLAAAALAIPVVAVDPWPIVALGMGASVSPVLKVAFLIAPMFTAAVFAFSGWSENRFRPAHGLRDLIALILITTVIYLVIYWLILPWGNPIAIPTVPR